MFSPSATAYYIFAEFALSLLLRLVKASVKPRGINSHSFLVYPPDLRICIKATFGASFLCSNLPTVCFIISDFHHANLESFYIDFYHKTSAYQHTQKGIDYPFRNNQYLLNLSHIFKWQMPIRIIFLSETVFHEKQNHISWFYSQGCLFLTILCHIVYSLSDIV